MDATYSYRIIRSSWGIRVDLTAELLPPSTDVSKAIEVASGIWLDIQERSLDETEKTFLELGLRLVENQIRASEKFAANSLIRVTKVWYMPTDYQPEGLTCAIAGWAATVFGFPMPDVKVMFDRSMNKYLFEFSSQ